MPQRAFILVCKPYNMYQHVQISVVSENLQQRVDRSKNGKDGKEKELSSLNRVRGQYARVPFPDVAFAHYHVARGKALK